MQLVVCGGQCDWREANRVLTNQSSSRSEDTWVFKPHAPPMGVCDNNLIIALQTLGELCRTKKVLLTSFTMASRRSSRRNVVTALRQFIEVDNHKACVSVK